MKSQQLLRSDAGNVLTEKVKKIALSANDDKRLQTYGEVISYQN